MKKRCTRHGFTLIEMLAVIAVIFILMAMLLPVMGRVRRAAHRAQCSHRMRQIYGAYQQRMEDERRNRVAMEWPLMEIQNWQSTLLDYLSLERRIFRCPADQEFESRTHWGSPGGQFFFHDTVGGLRDRSRGMGFREEVVFLRPDWHWDFWKFRDNVRNASGSQSYHENRSSVDNWSGFAKFTNFADPDSGDYRSPPSPTANNLGAEPLSVRFRGALRPPGPPNYFANRADAQGANVYDFRAIATAVDPVRETATVTVERLYSATGIYFETSSGRTLWGRPLDQGITGGSKPYTHLHNQASRGLVFGTYRMNDRWVRKLDSEDDHTGGSYIDEWEVPMTRSSFAMNHEAVGDSLALSTEQTWLLRDSRRNLTQQAYWHDNRGHVLYTDGSVVLVDAP